MIATELTVKQLENRDPGSGVAVIDRDALGDLGVSSGDFVAIRGRDGGRTVARVWPSDTSDAGRGIVRVDGQLRQAANVGIDDRVEVERTAVEPAERITVAPPEDPAAPAVTCGDVGGLDDTEVTMDHFERALDEVDADAGSEDHGVGAAPEAV